MTTPLRPQPPGITSRVSRSLAAFAALVGAAAGCSGGGKKETKPLVSGYVAPPAAGSQSASFAAVGSDAALAAAMEYPDVQIAEPAPPMSLTASDGTGLALVSLKAKAVIDGPLAFTELRLRFQNPRDAVIEGRFAITLPDGAAISRLAMHLEGSGWQEAEMVERQLARRAYEDFLHRRQDPALLEKEAGNEFRARIFPIPARGTKDIIISYSQSLAGADDVYRLPLQGLPEIETLAVEALLGKGGGPGKALTYEKVRLDQKGWTPDRDFEVAVQSDVAGLRSGNLVVARVEPALDAEIERMDGVVILFDTSASRAPGFAREVRELGELVAGLRADHGGTMALTVAAFDQVVSPIYSGKASGFGDEQLDAVRARRPLGASNLHAALGWAAKVEGARRVIVVSDAIPTYGPSESDALRDAARAMKGEVERLDVVLSGGIRDEELAGQLVRGVLEEDGVVLDGEQPTREIVRRLGLTTRSGIDVAVDGARWVWPQTLDGVQPGDAYLVFAETKSERGPATVRLSGGLDYVAEVPTVAAARPLVERAAMRAKIARIGFERDELPADARAEREAMVSRIVELSTRYRVLSDHTALLVLETDADYERYGIERDALADILVVGPRGIEVAHRAAPVVMVAPETTGETRKTTGKDVDKKKEKAEYKPDEAMLDLTTAPDDGLVAPGSEVRLNGHGQPDTATTVAAPPAPPAADPARAEEPRAVDSGEGRGGRVAADDRPVARRPEPMRRRLRPVPEADQDGDDEVSFGGATAAENDYIAAEDESEQEEERPTGPPPLTGKLAEVMAKLAAGDRDGALVDAIRWQGEEPGDVMALIALGEALEARGEGGLAARVYGSIIDLFPSRADMRRMAGERLERIGAAAADLTVDTYARAVEQRPDHLTAHRLYAFALVRVGRHADAFDALEAGLDRSYPAGRFDGGTRILAEDLRLVGAAWAAAAPAKKNAIAARLSKRDLTLADEPSLRFVLTWETDANDVDFHIWDGKGGHAFYSQKQLASGGELYADVTTGYGPECFAIEGEPAAYPYDLRIHYYSRGPMGYGMGKLEIVRHDGEGGLAFEQRPYVVMNDGAYVDLGTVEAPSEVAAAK